MTKLKVGDVVVANETVSKYITKGNRYVVISVDSTDNTVKIIADTGTVRDYFAFRFTKVDWEETPLKVNMKSYTVAKEGDEYIVLVVLKTEADRDTLLSILNN